MKDPIKFNLILYRLEIEAGINEIIMDALMASANKQAEPKPTLAEIVDNGKKKMMEAVECVIAKHEDDLKVIDNRIKLEVKTAQDSIGRYGNCNESRILLRNAAMMRSGHEQYLDSLVNGFAPRSLTGDANPIEQVNCHQMMALGQCQPQQRGIFGGWS
jgi:hypothetical protein